MRGKSAPAAIVSGMPPEKRGLISNTTGRPSTTRHWMLTAPANGSTRRRPSARSISAGRPDGAAAIDHAGADDDALARHDRERLAGEVAQHVDGELRTVEVLLHHRDGDVVEEEGQLARAVARESADAAAAAARLDEQRQRGVGRQLLGQPGRGGGDAAARAARGTVA